MLRRSGVANGDVVWLLKDFVVLPNGTQLLDLSYEDMRRAAASGAVRIASRRMCEGVWRAVWALAF